MLAILVYELVWTRFWKDLPPLNCFDLKSAILATSLSKEPPIQEARRWNGDAADRGAGGLRLMLGSSQLAIRLPSNGRPDSSTAAVSKSEDLALRSLLSSPQKASVSEKHLLQAY